MVGRSGDRWLNRAMTEIADKCLFVAQGRDCLKLYRLTAIFPQERLLLASQGYFKLPRK